MKPTLVATLWVAALGVSTAAWSQPPAAPAVTAQLDAFIARGMADWQIPGLSIVVVKDGAAVYEKGFGVRARGRDAAVDAHTLFGMMSTTKAMTALAVAMLVDEGKVRWDDPVTKHLPWFRLPDPYLTEHVTVRDALRHTSGVGNADLLWDREDLTTREILERMRFAPTTASLRSGWVYQNVMYQAAGEIVAAASGMPWERFVTTRILEPLGMARSAATYEAMAARADANVSTPHFEIDGELRAIEDVAVDRVPAAGSAWTTAHDAGKWLAFLLAGGQAGGTRLVSEAALAELLSPQAVIAAGSRAYPTAGLVGSRWTTYGLGWFQQDYRGRFVAMHTGSMDGRTAIVGLVPEERLGVFAFGNLDHAEFRHALLWKTIDLWTGAPERDWNAECLKLYGRLKEKQTRAEADGEAARVRDTRPSHPLDAYAGTYTHAAWGTADVLLEDGALVVRLGSSPRNRGRLEHWHFDTFRTRPGDGRRGWLPVSFETGLDGRVARLRLGDGMVFTRNATTK
jgi:CubicO group peptidase (beta-lactamase class C family)